MVVVKITELKGCPINDNYVIVSYNSICKCDIPLELLQDMMMRERDPVLCYSPPKTLPHNLREGVGLLYPVHRMQFFL